MSSLFALTFLASTSVAQPAGEPVRFEYRAPVGCPDAEAFVSRVQARTSRARLGAPGELARTFAVEVRVEAGGVSARLTFTDSRGASVVRAVRGETCDEVVSAIALVTALAIEAGTTEPSAPAEGAPTPSHDEGAREPEPVAAPPRQRALRKPEPNVVVGSLGAETGVTTWLGPSPTLGVGVFGEVGTYAGASGRLTLLGTASSTLVENEEVPGTYRRANFNALLARIEGCPVVAVLGSGFRVLPCVGVGLGALRGAGEERSVRPPKSSTIFWADLVPTLRLDWTLSDSLVFFGQGELGVPLVRHDFVFDGPRQQVFHVPAVGVGATLGMAWRFP
jgi:hypothetical protein